MKPLAGLSLPCVLLALLASQGCSNSLLRDRSNDYQQAEQAAPLQVPQGLDEQFRPLDPLLPIPDNVKQGGVQADYQVPRPQALPAAAPSEFSLQDSGSSRWILSQRSPAEVWPLAVSYFSDNGYSLARQSAQNGELITVWQPLPVTLSQHLSNPQGGEYRVRVRIEPGVQRGSSEIFVVSSQRPKGSKAEVPFAEQASKDSMLDASLLDELLAGLEQAAAKGGAVSLLAAHFDAPGKVSLSQAADGQPLLLLDTDFDRAWSSVGRSLESADLPIDDRNRTQGLYYIDSSKSSKKSGFFAKLWGEGKAKNQQYQIRLHENAGHVQVTVEQDGKPAPADTARRVLDLIQQNLG